MSYTLLLSLKVLHVFFAISWFAGIFYLPRIFVNIAAQPLGSPQFQLLVDMSRRLMRFTHITATGTLLFGLWLMILTRDYTFAWFWGKVFFLVCLILYHAWCQREVRHFQRIAAQYPAPLNPAASGSTTNPGQQPTLPPRLHSHVYYRWVNEIPVLFLLGILFFVIFKGLATRWW